VHLIGSFSANRAEPMASDAFSDMSKGSENLQAGLCGKSMTFLYNITIAGVFSECDTTHMIAFIFVLKT